MTGIRSNRISLRCILLLMVWIAGCNDERPASLFDPNQPSQPNPEITGMVPPNSALAGIGELVIQGRNFSTVNGENLVYFDDRQAAILSQSTSEIRVSSPNIVKDSIAVRIAIHGAFLFSNTIYYSLQTAVEEYGGYGNFDDVWGIAVDANENLYVSVVQRRVDKVSPDGSRQENYGTPNFLRANHMKVGPGGYLYLTRNTGTLSRIPPSGGNAEAFVSGLSTRIYDLDFNQGGNLFAAGEGDEVYVVKPDATSKVAATYPSAAIATVRVFNGYVYLGGNFANDQRAIWRNRIVAPDSLGPNELAFDATAMLSTGREILSLTFAADGDMYVGTSDVNPITVVHPDGGTEPLYEGVQSPETYAMAWGNGNYMYVNRRGSDAAVKRILRINMQKPGAPYYGRE